MVVSGCLTSIANRPVQTIDTGRGPVLTFSPSGEFVATTGSSLRIWRVRDGALAATLDCPAPVADLAFSPDARWLAGTLDEGRPERRIFIWSLKDRKIDTRLAFATGRSLTNGPIVFTPEGDLVALVSSTSVRGTTVVHWSKNGAFERPLGEHPTDEHPKNGRYWDPCIFRGEFSPDGSIIAVGREDKDGALDVFCTSTGDRVLTLESSARASAFAISKDMIAGAIAPNRVRLWSRNDGRALFDLEGRWDTDADTLWSLAFSPSGELLAGGGLDGRIHVWSVTDRERLKEIRAHQGVICSIGFSPKGDLIASAGWDGNVKFWEVDVDDVGPPR
ncbi:MAG: WD40 repeat domain-containing protein [Planctomycetota bacterium]